MKTLSNAPQDVTVIEAEARKSVITDGDILAVVQAIKEVDNEHSPAE